MPGLRMLSGSLRVARARILSPHGRALPYGGQGTADMAFEGWITALAWSLLRILCLPFSLLLPRSSSVSVSLKNR